MIDHCLCLWIWKGLILSIFAILFRNKMYHKLFRNRMYAIIHRRLIRVPANSVAPQFVAHFSSRKLPSDFSNGDATFTISYLTNSCRLSLNDAFSVSNKLRIKSRHTSDAVLQLLKTNGFTDAQISKLVTKWPGVLQSCADKTLSPKLEFFRSIGVPPAALTQKLSEYPFLLRRSFGNYFTPWYNYLKGIVQSDKNVVAVFLSSPMAFTHGWPERVPSNIAILRERGVPESSVASLMVNKPSMMILRKDKFGACVDRAAELGFPVTKVVFVRALQVFGRMSESTLKHKMEVYRRCGWSESDVNAAFLRHPLCMKLSQKKIRANMDFLVNELRLKPSEIAQCPSVLDYSCDRRMRPRWIVVRILKARGLMNESRSITSLFHMPEANFLKQCIVDHEEEFPELLDIYRGTISPPELVV